MGFKKKNYLYTLKYLWIKQYGVPFKISEVGQGREAEDSMWSSL